MGADGLRMLLLGAIGLLGLIFPMCECGIVVVMRRLLRKGLPLSCCIAYMLAGPIINLVVIFSTWVACRDHKIAPEMVGKETKPFCSYSVSVRDASLKTRWPLASSQLIEVR